MKRTPTERTERDHLEMMRHPERWSAHNGFVLPVENRNRKEPGVPGMHLNGFMFEEPGKGQARPRVYIGNIYMLGETPLEQFPFEDYPDLMAVVVAGWEVD